MNRDEYYAQIEQEVKREMLANDPVAQHVIRVPVSGYIKHPGTDRQQLVNGTIREVKLVDFLTSIKEQSVPDYFSAHQARLLNPKYSGTGRVARDVALEYLTEHYGFETADQLVAHAEYLKSLR